MPKGVYPRKCRPLAERFWAKVEKRGADECWPWTGCRLPRGGYGQIGALVDGQWRSVLASHVAWELHFDPVPAGQCVLHSCDNPPCVNPEHLFLGTYQDNSDDKLAKGRHRYGKGNRYGSGRMPPKGEAHGMAKLTVDEVRAIRASNGAARERSGTASGSQAPR